MAFYSVSLPVLPIVKSHLIINCVLVLLTLTVVGLRMLCRFESGAKLWWDDYLILFAVPQGIGMLLIQALCKSPYRFLLLSLGSPSLITLSLGAPMGVGYPIIETLPNLVPILKMLVAYELIFATCTSTIKMGVMFFYLRVFVNSGLRLAIKLVMGFVLLWSVGNILQVFLICRPFAAAYDPSIKGECGNQVGAFIAIGAFNVVTDAMILTLPIPTIWRLNMSRSTKAGISGVLLIGLM